MSSIKNDSAARLTDLITLNQIPGIGTNRLYQLVHAFGSASEVLVADRDALANIEGLSAKAARAILSKADRGAAEKIVESIIKLGWKYVIYDDPDYPEALINVDDKPPYLFYIGQLKPDDVNAVAVVGSRLASESALIFTHQLAGELARGNVTVISGMARGVDTSAHRGALENGGRTLAVFGCSLDIVYPPENRDLAKKIAESGALISEFLPKTIPNGFNFPRRNRIISGLSLGVVVVEAAEKSGALSTANHALSQNREVFAVPGSPRNKQSQGTNRLLKEGAVLVTSVEDIFEHLPRLKGQAKAAKIRFTENLTESEKKVLDLLGNGPVHIDILSREMASPLPDILQILLALELKGIIKELSGKRYILV